MRRDCSVDVFERRRCRECFTNNAAGMVHSASYDAVFRNHRFDSAFRKWSMFPDRPLGAQWALPFHLHAFVPLESSNSSFPHPSIALVPSRTSLCGDVRRVVHPKDVVGDTRSRDSVDPPISNPSFRFDPGFVGHPFPFQNGFSRDYWKMHVR